MMPEEQQSTAVGIKRRACVNCTTGKAKCSPWSDSVCDRCHRLEKDCVYLKVVSKRKSPKSNTRVQLLEKKVEWLVTVLASKESQTPAVTESPPQPSFTPGHLDVLHSSQHLHSPESSEGTEILTPLTSPPNSGSSDLAIFDVIDRGLVSIETAQTLLDQFRCKAVQNFPFVVIPSDATLNSVRKNTPFLFLSIIASMSVDDSPLQRRLGEEIRTQIHQRMLLGYESSLEMLQGLLVHISWHYYFILPHKQQALLLSQLCVTLVYQLEINKGLNKKRKARVDLRDHDQDYIDTSKIRAMLGTYYISSSIATSFRIRSTMPYTKYIEQCCLYLRQKKEFPTDELIWHFVRNQELSRRIQDTFSYDDLDNTEIRGEQCTNTTAKSFLSDLDNLLREVPPSLQDNYPLNLEFLFLRLWIQEVAFHNEFWENPDGDMAPGTPLAIKTFSSVIRMNILWEALQSYKDFFTKFIALPNSEMLYLTYPIFSKMCYTLISLTKMVRANLEETKERSCRPSDLPGGQTSACCSWGLRVAAKEGELLALARQIQEKFKANGTSAVSADGDPDAMMIFSLIISTMMSSYENQMKESQIALHNDAIQPSNPSPMNMQGQIIPEADSMILRSTDAMNLDYYGDGVLGQNLNFQVDIFEDPVWERLLDEFTMPPQ